TWSIAPIVRPHSPARTVSVRSWLAALLGNSFSFLPLRFRQPLTEASSNARSRERFQDAGPAWPSPLEFPSRAFPPAPTVKLSPVLSADPSNTEAAITRSGWPGIMATYVDILKTEFPEIDTELFDYITASRDDSAEPGYPESTDLLLARVTAGNNHHHPQKQVMLEAPVQLSQMSADSDRFSSDFLSLFISLQTVDARKLEKAEAKLKAKNERRNERDSQKASGPLVLEEASASQASNKKDSRADQSGKNRSYDIRIENFDISFGERCLLQGAELSLATGRRYGLIGRNGLGKTTLLKMLASRNLRVPAHISILHVEQEVAGDDTVALQSVLQSDTQREELLAEERRLNARIANGT
ncbi:hypothetical protein GOODEAATRI_019607, partial [Goodea atripinnis]